MGSASMHPSGFNKINVGAALAAAVATLLLLGLIHQNQLRLEQDIVVPFQQHQLTAARRLASMVELTFSSLEEELLAVAELIDERGMDEVGATVPRVYLEYLYRAHRDLLDCIAIVDATGQLELSTATCDGVLESSWPSEFATVEREAKFVVGEPFPSKSDPGTYVVQLMMPLRSQGRFDGAVLGELNLTRLWSRYTASAVGSRENFFWVVDDDGLILHHFEQSYIHRTWQDIELEWRRRKGDLLAETEHEEILEEELRRRVQSGDEGVSWYKNNLSGFTELLAYAPIHVAQQRYGLALATRKTLLDEPIAADNLRTLGLVALWGALCAGIGLLVLRESRLQAARSERDQMRELARRRSSELVKSRNQLAQSERLASLGTLAAGIAHEINNPIGGILNAAEYALLCEEDDDGHDQQREALGNIMHLAKRCGAIVANVLRFSRGEKSEHQLADAKTVIGSASEVVRGMARQNAVKVKLDLPDEPVPLIMNSLEIERVVSNLLSNAIQADPRSGTVEVRCQALPDTVRISVRDDGRGIDEDQLPRVFDPFFTTRRSRGGTGLGLSVAHGIVSDHGDSITAESRVGIGTTVTVDLPRGSHREAQAADDDTYGRGGAGV